MSNNLNRKSTYGKYACGKLSTLFVTRELQIKAIMRSCTPTRKGKTKQRLRVGNTAEHGVQWEQVLVARGIHKQCSRTARQPGSFLQSEHNLTGKRVNPTLSTAAPHPWAPGFQCLQFQLPANNCGPKMLDQDSRNKQFISLKWYPLLSSILKPCHTVPHPAQDVNYSFIQRGNVTHHESLSGLLGYQISCHGIAVFESKSHFT